MFNSIVVGTDGSPTATEAVKRAAALAAGWGVSCTS
ncbi:MAG TPA: universal stress protein [Thermoleophilaceae bacterium]|nr:universal stress protein [Thermoleophilaceae bacterium]